jgi:penicillin-binding protein 1C
VTKIVRAALGLLLAPLCALVVAATLEPLPAALSEPQSAAPSVRVLDRHGRLLRVVRADGGALGEHVALKDVSPELVRALIAGEDARFYLHPGIDPIAMLRAALQAVWHRHLVSGASTLTQQLARTLVPRPRTLRGKLHELVVALRIEASLSKQRILEEYVNRVDFGPNVRGVAAASRLYFDKPPSALDLAEAASLAAVVRGPAFYDPRRNAERVERRRNRILERMLDRELASESQVRAARVRRVVLQPGLPEGGAQHFVRALLAGQLEPELGPGRSRPQLVRTTLDAALQREVETLVARASERLAGYDATAAAVVVVDNASGGVLAYVGSPDFYASAALGQNDGARALRQPGSTLKPFVYAAAMERLGMTTASLLPDLELALPGAEGEWEPHNYDGRQHGPVRLRQALASSLNLPAVHVAQRVGPSRVLGLLREAGFRSLDRPAAHYGAALALGDGEVRLVELAEAYAMLARGGIHRRLRFAERAEFPDGRELDFARTETERVVAPETAALLSDVLSDETARAASFGFDSALDLPLAVAAKTGTSKGYRDNWTAGYTRAITVAVWVGNFDGRPLRGSSGVTGAAPLFRDVLLAAMRDRDDVPLAADVALVDIEVCALSGERAGRDCPHRVRERFAPSRVPTHDCSMHARVRIDPNNGLLAGPACADAVERVLEQYPDAYRAWAEQVGRPLVPRDPSPRCAAPSLGNRAAPAVLFPSDGARFFLDPGVEPDAQRIVLRARAATNRIAWVLDGRVLSEAASPSSMEWRLTPGRHVLNVRTPEGTRSNAVAFEVVGL